MNNIAALLRKINKKKLLFQHNMHEIEAIDNNSSFYIGVDPTAACIHIGHLVNMELVRIMSQLFKPIIMIGTFTAQIGDPSFKSKTRIAIDKNIIIKNTNEITRLLKTICANMNIHNVTFTNNEYLANMCLEEYMHMSSHFNIRNMLSSKAFTERGDHAMYLNEFIYSTLQSIDYYTLYRTHKCIIQIGGQDQWYNIVSGIKLIHRIVGVNTYALTVPLLLDNSGNKIGKTTSSGRIFNLDINSGHYYVYNTIMTWPEYIINHLFTIFEIDDNNRMSLSIYIVQIVFGTQYANNIVENINKHTGDDSLTPKHTASYKYVMKNILVNYTSKQIEQTLSSSLLKVNGVYIRNISEYYKQIVHEKNYIEYKQQFYCFINI